MEEEDKERRVGSNTDEGEGCCFSYFSTSLSLSIVEKIRLGYHPLGVSCGEELAECTPAG